MLPRGLLAAALVIALVGVVAAPRTGLGQTASPLLSPARIHIESPLGPGDTVQLPALAVRNEGSAVAEVTLSITPGDAAVGTIVDAAWVHFAPARFPLEPGASGVVDVWLEVPGDAEPAAYHALLRASMTPAASDAGTAVSVTAAVATDLRFTVEDRHMTAMDAVQSWWARYGIGAMLAMGAGTLTFVALSFARRFEIRRKGSP